MAYGISGVFGKTQGGLAVPADLVILEARVATMNPASPEATAVAVQGGRIVGIGPTAGIRTWIGPSTQVVEASGRRLIPGLIDSHLHLLGYGLLLERIALSGTSSREELQYQIKERAEQAGAGEWVLGGGWDEGRLGGLPSRHWLDQVAPDHPVFLARHCYHVGVANTLALKRAGLWDQTTAIPGGVIDRDASGWPTGVLRENAKERLEKAIPALTGTDYRRVLLRAAREVASYGITSVHSNDGQGFPPDEVFAAYTALQSGAEPLPIRVWWDLAVDDLNLAIARGWHSGLGSDMFKVGSVKFFADGSLGGRTAALHQPYEDDPGNRGILLWGTEAMAERMAKARRHGFQVAVHAIGDAAAEQVLEAYASVPRPARNPAHPAAGRLRLIHCQITSPALWQAMLQLGAVAEVQPRFLASDYPIIEARVGRARAETSYAWGSMVRLGIPLAFSSDCPVEPVNPMHAIYAAVTRQTMEGVPDGGWLPGESLSLAEAVAAHTRGPAYAVGEERDKGQISPGFLADMVLFEDDPFEAEPARLKDIRVALTIVGGRVVYRK